MTAPGFVPGGLSYFLGFHVTSPMKFHLRATWILIYLSILLIASALLSARLHTMAYLSLVRSSFQSSQISLTTSIRVITENDIRQSGLEGINPNFSHLQKSTQATRLSLVKTDGTLLADSSDTLQPPIDLALVKEAAANRSSIRWKPGTDILLIGTVLNLPTSLGAAVLVREVDLSAELAPIHEEITRQIITSLSITLLCSLLAMYVIWQLGLQPFTRMIKVAKSVRDGDEIIRAPQMIITEINDVGNSFNQMLDQLDSQRDSLKDMNYNLEKTVAERTAELKLAYQKLQQRASSLETVNDFIGKTATAHNLQELLDVSLIASMRSLGIQSGIIWVGCTNSHMGIPDEILSQIIDIGHENNQVKKTRLIVNDWSNDQLVPAYWVNLRELFLQSGIRSSATCPILVKNQPVGRVSLGSSQPNYWTAEWIALVEIFSQQLGSAVERLQVIEEIRTNNQMMSRLIKQSELLNRHFSIKEITTTIATGGLEISGATRGVFVLITEDNHFDYQWSTGVSRSFIQKGLSQQEETTAFKILSNPFPILISDISKLEPNSFTRLNAPTENIQAMSIWPLVYEGRPIAIHASFYDQTTTWPQTVQELMQTFFRQAAIALMNAQLLESEHEQRNLAEGLRDVSSAMNSTLELNEVFDRILSNLGKVIAHDAADVMMIDNGYLTIIRSQGFPPDQYDPIKNFHKPVHSLVNFTKMIKTGQSLVISNTEQEPTWIVMAGSQWIRSYAGAPIRSHGRVVGFVNVASSQSGFFNARHAAILQSFADQASIAVENASKYETTRERMAETGTLFRALTPLFNAGSDLQTICDQIVEAVVREFSPAHCSLLILNENDPEINLISETGKYTLGKHTLALSGPGIVALAARTGQTIYSPDVHNDPRYLYSTLKTNTELALPLIIGTRVIGVLNLEDTVLDAFNQQVQRLLASFAERAALVVENARLLESTRKSARQVALLNQITRTSLQGTDFTSMLQNIIVNVAELLQADACSITRWDESQQTASAVVNWGPLADRFTELVNDPTQISLTEQVIKAGRSITIPDIRSTTISILPPTTDIPIRSILSAPMISGKQGFGAILIGRTTLHTFSEQEINLAEQAAGQLALALVKMHSLESAQRKAKESEKLRQATSALTTNLDFTQVVERTFTHLESLIDYDHLTLLLIENDILRPVGGMNLPSTEQPTDEYFSLELPIFSEMKTTGLPITRADVQADPDFPIQLKQSSTRSWIGIPLIADDEMLGALSISRKILQPFTSEEIVLARVFANQASVALQNAQLHARMQQMAITDPLTGLYNRRGFFELAQHELERSRRTNRPAAVLMLDLDRFKNINDKYGHHVGDIVLAGIAERFRSVLRDADLICRYGGEEFCAFLPESDLNGAAAAAQRMQDSLRSHPFDTEAGPVSITVSIGISEMQAASDSLEKLLDQADEALLKSKGLGRDRVSIWNLPETNEKGGNQRWSNPF